VQRAEHGDRPRSRLGLGLESRQPGAGIGGLVVDGAALEARQDLLAHGLGLLDRLGLGRPEQRLAERRPREADGERGRQEARSGGGHGFSP